MTNEPKLELLCEYYATLKPPVVVGNGPYGMRMIYDVTGGEVTGPRLRGRVLPSGADWILVGTDGVGRLDVRATIETHDGATLHGTNQSAHALRGFAHPVRYAVGDGTTMTVTTGLVMYSLSARTST